MEITLLKYPTDEDWLEVKRRALVTVGKNAINPPDETWKHAILKARHSPIRYLQFSFLLIDIPSWVSVHLVRHVHAQPYVKSQRNDRQSDYDRTTAPQNTPVTMIWDMNAEEFLTIMNKRLCKLAAEETRFVAETMATLTTNACPEFTGLCVPSCKGRPDNCEEMFPCFNTPNKE